MCDLWMAANSFTLVRTLRLLVIKCRDDWKLDWITWERTDLLHGKNKDKRDGFQSSDVCIRNGCYQWVFIACLFACVLQNLQVVCQVLTVSHNCHTSEVMVHKLMHVSTHLQIIFSDYAYQFKVHQIIQFYMHTYMRTCKPTYPHTCTNAHVHARLHVYLHV